IRRLGEKCIRYGAKPRVLRLGRRLSKFFGGRFRSTCHLATCIGEGHVTSFIAVIHFNAFSKLSIGNPMTLLVEPSTTVRYGSFGISIAYAPEQPSHLRVRR